MKNVHSLAFYRHNASGYESERAGVARGIFFINFLPAVIRAHHIAWKGWELRIHHDDRVRDFAYFKALEIMDREGLIKLVPMGKADTLTGSMLWRLAPVFDEDVDWVVCRDLDSMPMHRDRKMVEEAMASGAEAHAILDSESHSGPLMGGMTAFRSRVVRVVVPGMRELESSMQATGIDFNQHGGDQLWLNKILWPRIKDKTMIHQRRRDIAYPDAMETKLVAPQETALDKVIRHVGAGFKREIADPAIAIMDQNEVLTGARNSSIVTIENCEREAGVQCGG